MRIVDWRAIGKNDSGVPETGFRDVTIPLNSPEALKFCAQTIRSFGQEADTAHDRLHRVLAQWAQQEIEIDWDVWPERSRRAFLIQDTPSVIRLEKHFEAFDGNGLHESGKPILASPTAEVAARSLVAGIKRHLFGMLHRITGVPGIRPVLVWRNVPEISFIENFDSDYLPRGIGAYCRCVFLTVKEGDTIDLGKDTERGFT